MPLLRWYPVSGLAVGLAFVLWCPFTRGLGHALFPPDRAPLAWAPVYYLRPLWGMSLVLVGWCGSFRGMCALVSPVVLAMAHGVVGV